MAVDKAEVSSLQIFLKKWLAATRSPCICCDVLKEISGETNDINLEHKVKQSLMYIEKSCVKGDHVGTL